jgi:hypothetical protein
MNATEAQTISDRFYKKDNIEIISDSIRLLACIGEYNYVSYSLESQEASKLKLYFSALGFKVSKNKDNNCDRFGNSDNTYKLKISWEK